MYESTLSTWGRNVRICVHLVQHRMVRGRAGMKCRIGKLAGATAEASSSGHASAVIALRRDDRFFRLSWVAAALTGKVDD